MSVVAGSFTLQGSRSGSTVVLFFFFLFHLHYPKILQAQPKMLRIVDLVCLQEQKILRVQLKITTATDANHQKFQMPFERSNSELQLSHEMMTSPS